MKLLDFTARSSVKSSTRLNRTCPSEKTWRCVLPNELIITLLGTPGKILWQKWYVCVRCTDVCRVCIDVVADVFVWNYPGHCQLTDAPRETYLPLALPDISEESWRVHWLASIVGDYFVGFGFSSACDRVQSSCRYGKSICIKRRWRKLK